MKKLMNKRTGRAFLFALTLIPVAAIGGYFSVRLLLSSLDPSMLEEAISKAGSEEIMLAVSVIMTVVYATVLGFFGWIISEKIGLARPIKFQKKNLIPVLVISMIGGVVFSLDAWTFGQWIPEVGSGYAATGSFDIGTWVASVLYGGVIEEVMMRLFCMGLFVLIGWKLFFRGKTEMEIPVGCFVFANILSALLFAAGHLPATIVSFGGLTPLLVFRCFLMNGAFGLIFGRIYRKHGIQYAMLAHMMFHLVSRTIWLIAF